MGAQFTAQEAENFGKTLADITDPKEYIKAVYQVKAVMAYINLARKTYLDRHPNNMAAANDAWVESGEEKRLLNEGVDYLRERAARNAAKGNAAAPSAAAKPKTTALSNISSDERAAAILWLENNPNDKDAPEIRRRLGLPEVRKVKNN
jgi:hypothetical protein